MALTFREMVQQAQAVVPGLKPEEAREKSRRQPDTLVIDVQDAVDAGACGLIPGGINISLGMLPIRADMELPEQRRAPELHDRARPVMVTCGAGGQAAIGAHLLKQMGFTDVAYIDGGTADVEAALQKAVSAGKMSETRATAIEQHLPARIDRFVTRTFAGHGRVDGPNGAPSASPNVS